jgi:hypothetical protein
MARPKDAKKKKSKWPFGLRIGGLYASSFGFLVMVFGAIWAWEVDSSVGLSVAIAGLGLFSAGLGLISVGLGKESDERMQAMANSEFREKMAMVAGYMGDWSGWHAKERQYRNRRIEQDLRAALELEGWVKDPRLRCDFRTLLERFKEMVEQTGETELSSILQGILQQLEDW